MSVLYVLRSFGHHLKFFLGNSIYESYRLIYEKLERTIPLNNSIRLAYNNK